jgi:hypothetical protein
MGISSPSTGSPVPTTRSTSGPTTSQTSDQASRAGAANAAGCFARKIASAASL